MSIKRVSDLPQVTKSKMDIDCFKNSFFEISYLSDMQNEYIKYESSKIKVWDIVSAAAEAALFFPKLSGDVYVNEDLSAEDPGKYTIDMRAGDIRFYSSNPTYFRHLQAESAYVSNLFIHKDYQVSSLSTYDGHYGVNIDLLKAYVDDRLKNFKTGAGVPYLSFIFSDRDINDDEWKKAGSSIELTDYVLLSSSIIDPSSGKLKNEYRQLSDLTDDERDTWYYELEGNTLTLPQASCFIMGVGDADAEDIGKFYRAAAPNISGDIISKTIAQGEREPLTYSDRITFENSSAIQLTRRTNGSTYGASRGGNGTAYLGLNMNASRSSEVYKNGVKTITPDHVKMYVYFYVGPKNS